MVAKESGSTQIKISFVFMKTAPKMKGEKHDNNFLNDIYPVHLHSMKHISTFVCLPFFAISFMEQSDKWESKEVE